MAETATLTNGTITIPLPKQLEWIDEFAWSSIVRSKEYSVTGALIVEDFEKQTGRPITLSGGDDQTWIYKNELDVIHSWSLIPGLELVLTLTDGRQFTVIFDENPISASAIYPNHTYQFPYYLTLKFICVD